MEDGKGDEPTKNTGEIRIVLDVSSEDAERLRKAFESGLLDYLGIKGVNIIQPSDPESDPQQKKWASDEQTRQPRQNKPDNKTPPFPG